MMIAGAKSSVINPDRHETLQVRTPTSASSSHSKLVPYGSGGGGGHSKKCNSICKVKVTYVVLVIMNLDRPLESIPVLRCDLLRMALRIGLEKD